MALRVARFAASEQCIGQASGVVGRDGCILATGGAFGSTAGRAGRQGVLAQARGGATAEASAAGV
ncbi:protein of unknown function [Thiomonas sp. Bio17B3]|nr:protein of unknown function [Thiomonas sp. Bio17B3]VDY13242.1 protein of unknown function [Thiomonas sp. OC7]